MSRHIRPKSILQTDTCLVVSVLTFLGSILVFVSQEDCSSLPFECAFSSSSGMPRYRRCSADPGFSGFSLLFQNPERVTRVDSGLSRSFHSGKLASISDVVRQNPYTTPCSGYQHTNTNQCIMVWRDHVCILFIFSSRSLNISRKAD